MKDCIFNRHDHIVWCCACLCVCVSICLTWTLTSFWCLLYFTDAGYISEHSAYHHGEASLTQTIIGKCIQTICCAPTLMLSLTPFILSEDHMSIEMYVSIRSYSCFDYTVIIKSALLLRYSQEWRRTSSAATTSICSVHADNSVIIIINIEYSPWYLLHYWTELTLPLTYSPIILPFSPL